MQRKKITRFKLVSNILVTIQWPSSVQCFADRVLFGWVYPCEISFTDKLYTDEGHCIVTETEYQLKSGCYSVGVRVKEISHGYIQPHRTLQTSIIV